MPLQSIFSSFRPKKGKSSSKPRKIDISSPTYVEQTLHIDHTNMSGVALMHMIENPRMMRPMMPGSQPNTGSPSSGRSRATTFSPATAPVHTPPSSLPAPRHIRSTSTHSQGTLVSLDDVVPTMHDVFDRRPRVRSNLPEEWALVSHDDLRTSQRSTASSSAYGSMVQLNHTTRTHGEFNHRVINEDYAPSEQMRRRTESRDFLDDSERKTSVGGLGGHYEKANHMKNPYGSLQSILKRPKKLPPPPPQRGLPLSPSGQRTAPMPPPRNVISPGWVGPTLAKMKERDTLSYSMPQLVQATRMEVIPDTSRESSKSVMPQLDMTSTVTISVNIRDGTTEMRKITNMRLPPRESEIYEDIDQNMTKRREERREKEAAKGDSEDEKKVSNKPSWGWESEDDDEDRVYRL